MSETIRSYDGSKAALGVGGPPRRSSRFPYFSLVVAAALLVIMIWTTRDAYSIEEFLPVNKPLQIRMEKAVGARQRLGASPLWALLPDDESTDKVREVFRGPLPVPEWLAKNLFNQEVFWFGDADTGEGVVVSRMTRVGTVVARIARFLPAAERDWAGGLNLQSLPEPGVYFATRGRVLIAGTSRRAVIESLTLGEGECAELGGFLVEPPNDSVLTGAAVLPPEEAERFGVARVEFGVVSGSQSIALVAKGELSGGSSSFASLLSQSRPQTLHAPYDAPAALVLSAGMPLRELTIALGEAAGTRWPDAAQWDEWSAPPDNDRDRLSIPALLAQLGPEIQVTLHGVDVNEVLPVPEIVISNPNPEDAVLRALTEFPPPVAGASIDAVRAAYNPESGVLTVPAPGGDSLEPSAAIHGGRFVFSTSLNRLNAILAGSPPQGSLPGENNAYLKVQPGQVADVAAAVGNVLAENGLLKDFTPESFEAQAAEWREDFAAIDAVEAALRSDGATVTLECEVRFRE